MSIENGKLPPNWSVETLREVSTKIVDGSHNPPQKQDTGRPMLSARNIENNQIVFNNYRLIADNDFDREHLRTKATPDDVLLTIVGTIGRTAVVLKSTPEFTLQRSVAVITPNKLLPKFLMYQFQAPFFQKYFEDSARGTAQKGVYLKTLGASPVIVAPLEDQKQIVAEIEKQFSRLDEAVASLKRIQANLKRYKAAVLKAAVEGKLTEQWRKDHPDVEPADQLLKRILAERRAKWEDGELAKMKAKRIKPKDDSWKKKYKAPELSVSDTSLFSWITALVGSICEIEDGDRGENYPKKTDFMNDGYCLFLSTKNVRPDGFLFDQIQFICKEKHENLRKGLLERGDIVFTSRGTLGNIAHYVDSVPYGCVRINSGMFILRGFSVFMIEEYFDYYLKSPAVRTQIDKLQSGTAQPQLPIREFKTFEVKFPSKVEQEIIVQEIDRRLSVTEELEITIGTNLKRAERLRQTILQQAFSGGLV
jgi:type I restriction enzyme, S subunit